MMKEVLAGDSYLYLRKALSNSKKGIPNSHQMGMYEMAERCLNLPELMIEDLTEEQKEREEEENA